MNQVYNADFIDKIKYNEIKLSHIDLNKIESYQGKEQFVQIIILNQDKINLDLSCFNSFLLELKNLVKVDIKLKEFREILDRNLLSLVQTLFKLPLINELNLNLGFIYCSNFKEINNDTLVNCINLKKLKIEWKINFLGIINYEMLFQMIRQCVNLQEFSIKLYDKLFRNQQLIQLWEAIPFEIEVLELNVNSIINLDGIKQVQSYKKNFSKLRDFKLNLEFPEIGNDKVESNPILFIDSMPNIQSLEININHCKIKSKSFSSLISSIRSCQSLENFKLFAGKNFIGPNGIKELGSSISQCLQLKDVSISLFSNPILMISDLIDSFQNCLGLQNLALQLRRCQINRYEAICIGKSLSQLSQLQRFQLVLSSNPIDNQGILEILKGISNWKKLEYLDLQLQLCGLSIVDAAFFEDIEKLDNLNTLQLRLSKNIVCSHEQIIQIAKSVSKCKKLQRFTLYLSNNKSSSFPLIPFIDSILQCQQLDSLKLVLKYIPQTLYEDCWLNKGLSSPQNIKELYLDLVNIIDQNFKCLCYQLQYFSNLAMLEIRQIKIFRQYLFNTFFLYKYQRGQYLNESDFELLYNSIKQLKKLVVLKIDLMQFNYQKSPYFNSIFQTDILAFQSSQFRNILVCLRKV